jgi:ribosomal protein S25
MTSNIYTSPISKKKWNNLWHCKEGYRWKRLWSGKYGDDQTTVSQFEYTICCYCWRKRLNEDDIVKVVAAWWKKHGIEGNFYHLRRYTIPKSFKFVEPYLHIIEGKHRVRSRIEQRKRRKRRQEEQIAGGIRFERTRDRIFHHVESAGNVTVKDVADALGLSSAVIRRQLARMTAEGIFERISRGRYRTVVVRHE